MFRSTEMHEKRTIATPEIDLADGRFEARAATLRTAYAVVLWLVASGAAYLLKFVAPDPYEGWGWGQAVAGLLLMGIAVGAGWSGLDTYRLMRRGWRSYQAYLEDRRAVHLEGLEAVQGVSIERSVREDELSLDRLSDVIVLIVYAWLSGKATVRALSGPLLIGQQRMTRLGELSRYNAEQAARLLEELGTLEGQGERAARAVADEPLEVLILRAAERWGRS